MSFDFELIQVFYVLIVGRLFEFGASCEGVRIKLLVQ
jgi:hypothetical protein